MEELRGLLENLPGTLRGQLREELHLALRGRLQQEVERPPTGVPWSPSTMSAPRSTAASLSDCKVAFDYVGAAIEPVATHWRAHGGEMGRAAVVVAAVELADFDAEVGADEVQGQLLHSLTVDAIRVAALFRGDPEARSLCLLLSLLLLLSLHVLSVF